MALKKKPTNESLRFMSRNSVVVGNQNSEKHVPLPTVVKELLNYTSTFQGMPIEPYVVGGFNPFEKY